MTRQGATNARWFLLHILVACVGACTMILIGGI